MSWRSQRQNVAPGVSPGIGTQLNTKPALAGDRDVVNICRPCGGSKLFWVGDPGLTPGATNMPPVPQAR